MVRTTSREELKHEKIKLMRQDDNGIKTVVYESDSKIVLEALQKKLEAKVHKQIYWIEHIKNNK